MNDINLNTIMFTSFNNSIFSFTQYSPDLDNNTRETFNRKKECLIKQYFNFEMKQIRKFVSISA